MDWCTGYDYFDVCWWYCVVFFLVVRCSCLFMCVYALRVCTYDSRLRIINVVIVPFCFAVGICGKQLRMLRKPCARVV